MVVKNHGQTASAILMVRPAGFGFNEETAGTNAFQTKDRNTSDEALQTCALKEFDGLVKALRSADVEVILFDDTPEPKKPDAIFPNNWISLHEDGTVFLYPMLAPLRRLERRIDIVESLKKLHKYDVSRVVDLSDYETQGKFLEGTGSIVFDYQFRHAYANISPRTDPLVLREVTGHLGYDLVAFSATDAQGIDIYHTNVVMSIGSYFAVICAEAIDDAHQRDTVLSLLGNTGRHLILVDRLQMVHFTSNILEVKSRAGESVVVMSDRSLKSFRPEQLEILQVHSKIVSSPIPTIERIEGGSARCMMAAIYLPRKPGHSKPIY